MTRFLKTLLILSVVLMATLPAWAEEQPLKLELEISKTDYILLEPIEVLITLTNTGTEPFLMPSASLQPYSCSQIVFEVLKEGNPIKYKGELARCGPYQEKILEASETTFATINLASSYILTEPGEYSVRAHWLHVEALPLAIIVRRPEGREKEVLVFLHRWLEDFYNEKAREYSQKNGTKLKSVLFKTVQTRLFGGGFTGMYEILKKEHPGSVYTKLALAQSTQLSCNYFKNPEQAEAQLATLENIPSKQRVYRCLGTHYERLGKFTKALECFKKSILFGKNNLSVGGAKERLEEDKIRLMKKIKSSK